jgi:hypothetical protein
MSALKGNTLFVLLNEDNGTFETFEDEDDLKEFLEDEEFTRSELKDLRVVEVSSEYEVTPSYELEEI